MTREEALSRVPAHVSTLTMSQLQHAAGLTSPLPIRKWVHQGRITPSRRPGHEGEFDREEVMRFLANRFSPYSLLEARFFRAGITLAVQFGAAADLDFDLPKLHARLDGLLDDLGQTSYERIIDIIRNRRPARIPIDDPTDRRFVRTGLKLAHTVATGDLAADRPRLHAALDDYISGLGGAAAWEWAVGRRAHQLGRALMIIDRR